VNQRVFNEALLAVFNLMANDTLPRFRKTPKGQDIVETALEMLAKEVPCLFFLFSPRLMHLMTIYLLFKESKSENSPLVSSRDSDASMYRSMDTSDDSESVTGRNKDRSPRLSSKADKEKKYSDQRQEAEKLFRDRRKFTI